MNFVQNILWNSVSGFVEAGTRTAGGYAGDALIKAGDLIENSGRSVGNGLERRASSYGKGIAGQGYQSTPSPGKALPSTARKPALKRSNSSPASTTALSKAKPANTKAIGPTSKTPIGAKKYVGGAPGNTATKAITGTSKGVTGGLVGGVGGAQKAITNNASKAPINTFGAAKGAAGSATRNLPKPYPNNPSKTSTLSNPLPRPYNTPAFPGQEKKTAVKPGQSKPFNAQAAKKLDEKKPYPGTNTLPGQASKTPVKKYKPLPTMSGTAEKGKIQHIAV